MEIGERIHTLRKKNGLSQGTLAQQLSVSRQTISQWEQGQTVPSMDNIYKLRDIFNVSFDEIFTDNPVEKVEEKVPEEQPEESFTITYTKEDAKAVKRIVYSRTIKIICVFIFVLIWTLVSIFFSDAPDLAIGYMIGFLTLTVILGIIVFVNAQKTYKNFSSKFSELKYNYDVYKDRFVIKVLEEDAEINVITVRKKLIEKIWINKNYLLFSRAGQIFLLKKDLVSEKFFKSEFFKNRELEYKNETMNLMISTVLLIGSLITIFIAMFCISQWATEASRMIEKMWLFFLFTPVPIISVIYGIVRQKKGGKGKINIVVGAIMIVLLCLFGSFSIIYVDAEKNNSAFAEHMEEIINENILEPDSYSSQN